MLFRSERYPIELMIRFDQASEIIRPSTNARVEFRNNTIRVQLQPFELQVFRGSQLTRIVRVETLVPPIERARVQAQVGWIEASAKGSLANMLILTDAQKQLLRLAAAEARSALAEGRLWRARTLLERFDLQEIYARLGSAPPRLRDPEDR